MTGASGLPPGRSRTLRVSVRGAGSALAYSSIDFIVAALLPISFVKRRGRCRDSFGETMDKRFHRQIQVQLFPMKRPAIADQFPGLALGWTGFEQARIQSQRDRNFAAIVERHDHSVAREAQAGRALLRQLRSSPAADVANGHAGLGARPLLRGAGGVN